MTNPKKYRLLKDLPDLKATPEVIFERKGDVTMPTHRDYSYSTPARRYWYSPALVENSPDWFEEVTDTPEKERIEVREFWFECNSNKGGAEYCFEVSDIIPEDKKLSIKKAIEEVLNPPASTPAPEKMDIKDNVIELLKEDLEGIHHYLDDLSLPRQDDKGERYSIVGRIKQLEKHYMKKLSEIESEYLQKEKDAIPLGKVQPPTPAPEDKGWQITKGCAKNGGIHEWHPDNSHGGRSCKESGCEIWEVRRTSDNTVWAIGEQTKHGYIKQMKVGVNNRGIIDMSQIYVSITSDKEMFDLCAGLYLSDLQKLPPKPLALFTTEDGKDIFEGNTYWMLKPDGEIYEADKASKDGGSGQCLENKYFSTEEAANEYCINNKKVFSLEEVLYVTKGLIIDSTKEWLTQKAKERQSR